MKTKDLPEAINHKIQDLMMDVFETLGSIRRDTFLVEDFLSTKKYYLEALRLLDSTDYLNEGVNADLITAIRLEVESQETAPSDRLVCCWMAQKVNLERATSQENFNATFAVFVPVIVGLMNEVSIQEAT